MLAETFHVAKKNHSPFSNNRVVTAMDRMEFTDVDCPKSMYFQTPRTLKSDVRTTSEPGHWNGVARLIPELASGCPESVSGL